MTIYYPQQHAYEGTRYAIRADSFDYDHHFAGVASSEYIPGLGKIYEVYPTCHACRADWTTHQRRDEDCPAAGPLYRVFIKEIG
jgi:hypothetical protein